VLRRLLEFAGHDVLEAVDGVEGTNLLRRHACDLVLCDIYMPRESGLWTIQRLCREFPGLRVVAMTGGGFDQEQDALPDALRVGATAFLRKPFRVESLLGVIGETLAISLRQEP
jgi:CheY-like chemotaxis protein